jgi:hypothetical protein
MLSEVLRGGRDPMRADRVLCWGHGTTRVPAVGEVDNKDGKDNKERDE